MEMAAGLDTGAVYACEKLPLDGTERADLLESARGELAAKSVVPVLNGIADGSLVKQEQDHGSATVCRKICKDHGQMDFRRPAAELYAQIRAYTPWPGAYFELELPDKEIRITVCDAVIEPGSGEPGTILSCDKRGWSIMCGDAALSLKSVSIPGKRTMSVTDFLNGLRGAVMHIKMKENS